MSLRFATDFPTIIPPSDRDELDIQMLRCEREVSPLLKQWEEVAPGHGTIERLERALIDWCCEQLKTARHLFMSWIQKNEPSCDAEYRSRTEQEIRDTGRRHADSTLEHFEGLHYLVQASRHEIRRAKRRIVHEAEEVVRYWIQEFRDWARALPRKRQAEPTG